MNHCTAKNKHDLSTVSSDLTIKEWPRFSAKHFSKADIMLVMNCTSLRLEGNLTLKQVELQGHAYFEKEQLIV